MNFFIYSTCNKAHAIFRLHHYENIIKVAIQISYFTNNFKFIDLLKINLVCRFSNWKIQNCKFY